MKDPRFQPNRSLRTPQYYQSRRPVVMASQTDLESTNHRHHWRFIIYLAVLGIIATMLVHTFILSPNSHSQTPSLVHQGSLAKNIHAILQKNNQYQIGIALIDVTNGQTQTFGETTPFEAASTAKIITACAFYHLVETGGASLNGPMGDYDAGFQLKEMVNDSDNTSWNLITNTVGNDRLQAYADSIGGVDYNEANNTLTPAGMAMLLTKLYKGELLNSDHTQQLLSYMQNTNDESLIPEALPGNVSVYHKYGLLNGELHDASILTQDGKTYSLVIYTKSDTDADDSDRTTLIHQLTQTITTTIFPS